MHKLALFLFSVSLVSCKKDINLEEPEIKNASVNVEFVATVKGAPLVPVTRYYSIISQEAFTIAKFNYYVSNVRLKRSDGSYFTEPESYHLIKHIDNITKFSINDVPPGDYTSIEYLIGVDSLRNVSGAQSGDLDPAKLMFWDWDTGYIFFKLEGQYGTASIEDAEYAIHVGGFQAPYSCLQTVSLAFPSTLSIKSNGVHQIDLNTSIDEIFKNPTDIGFDYYYKEVVKGPKIFQDLSKNYRDMFTVKSVN